MTEIKDLCSIVAKMASKTLDVLSVSIWLADEFQDRLVLGGSTMFSEGQHQMLKSVENIVNEMVPVMRLEKLPIDFDYSKGDRAPGKMESNGNFFYETRIPYCLPLIARERFLGVMTLGDRVGAEDFSAEDFDLLKTIADQTAVRAIEVGPSQVIEFMSLF